MVSAVIKNWDNKTWLSSQDYINSINQFLTKKTKLNSNSKILDIGCGRGKILGNLSSKLKLKNRPLGIDIVSHKDKDKRIKFKKVDASFFFLKNNEKFDLIIIKQTIHLLDSSKIRKLLSLLKKNLRPNGKIFIFALNSYKNEWPAFKLMQIRLNKSLKKDQKILSLITNLYPNRIIKKFFYKVKISKKKYLEMIKKRYTTILLPMTNKELSKGIVEINLKLPKTLRFNDNLICIIIKNN